MNQEYVYVGKAFEHEDDEYTPIEQVVHTSANDARHDLEQLLDGREDECADSQRSVGSETDSADSVEYSQIRVEKERLYEGEDSQDTLALPRDALGKYLYEQAMEWTDVEGPHLSDREGWSLNDGWSYPDFEDVEEIDEGTVGSARHLQGHFSEYDEDTPMVFFHGSVEATQSRKVARAKLNPPSKAHPAEYENEDVELLFTLAVPLDDPFNSSPLMEFEVA